MPRKYRLLIAYDGTPFCGWQAQPNGITVQQAIQHALGVVLRTSISVIGAGRTDAGVHAEGQVAHFSCDTPFDTHRLLRATNALLPREIRILDLQETSADFHARYSATAKEYHYRIYLGTMLDPFRRLYTWHLPYALDLSLLRAASKQFLGTRDFTSFANEGYKKIHPVRTLLRIDLLQNAEEICLEFEGDGFLYKMVRNITGALVDVARGKTPLAHIPAIFAHRDRRFAPPAAPPHGLSLYKVQYANLTELPIYSTGP